MTGGETVPHRTLGSAHLLGLGLGLGLMLGLGLEGLGVHLGLVRALQSGELVRGAYALALARRGLAGPLAWLGARVAVRVRVRVRVSEI